MANILAVRLSSGTFSQLLRSQQLHCPDLLYDKTQHMKKAILVTGGGRGIGAAISRLAAAQGYAVAINYLRDDTSAKALVAAITAEGGTAYAVKGDVAIEADVGKMFETAESILGPLYGLINNAGITGRIGKFISADPTSVEQVFRTNVFGTMNCCRAALRCFQRTGSAGVIVNISSIAAATGSPHEYVHYAASKAAIETFTLGLAREVAADNIRVCAVAPGSTLTEIHATAGEPDRPARVAPKIPMQRLAAPEEIAEPIIWLLSDAASYMTGATVRCAGGL
jgi:NAD(P)-dependent dehydrogenase (short-subunit alcohol dehydrogenase family)